MSQIYDARGNLYAVTTPQALRELGIDIADDAAKAAANARQWTRAAVHALCNWPDDSRPEGAKAHRCDGLLVGPFEQSIVFEESASFDLLIINTDGTLAERSGNGLTIFAQALSDAGRVGAQGTFELRVHHNQRVSATPVCTEVEPATIAEQSGFWLALGRATFGPEAVAAQRGGLQQTILNGRALEHVPPLAALDPAWQHSVFVRIGNPHCVTLLDDPHHLPGFQALHQPPLNPALTRIAFAQGEQGSGEVCPAGVNLQWACVQSTNHLLARVFERGEGPTASSGTSASAVACAAWRAGLVDAGLVHVSMPGGTAPVRLTEDDGELRVALFGVARVQQLT